MPLQTQKKCFLSWSVTLIFTVSLLFSGLSLAQTPQRIVSLKPNITQILVALGRGEDLVGITKFCKKPNDSAQVIADYTSIAIEQVVRLKPSLVITSSENAQERQIRQLQKLGVPLLLTNFNTYDNMIDSLQKIALATGSAAAGTKIKQALENTWGEIKTLASLHHLNGKRFIVLVQHYPIMLAAGQTYISTLLTRLGMTNTIEASLIAYPQLSEEDFLRAPVDIIFDLSYDTNSEPAVLGRPVVILPINDFLAEPGSVGALKTILEKLK